MRNALAAQIRQPKAVLRVRIANIAAALPPFRRRRFVLRDSLPIAIHPTQKIPRLAVPLRGGKLEPAQRLAIALPRAFAIIISVANFILRGGVARLCMLQRCGKVLRNGGRDQANNGKTKTNKGGMHGGGIIANAKPAKGAIMRLVNMQTLRRFFNPRSVVFVGGKWARVAAAQCQKANPKLRLFFVHPQKRGATGMPCFARVADLPQQVDAAFVAVNNRAAVGVVAALAKAGCGGAACFASGYKEEGAAALQTQLVRAAANMPLLGPNCYGYVNYAARPAPAVLWPDQHGGNPRAGGVAVLSQSGNMAINITMQRRGLPLAFVCAVGNTAQTGFAALTNMLLQDARISAIGWVLEGAPNPRELAQTLRRARGKKPVVALKLGASAQGARAAQTHTASAGGANAAASAFFARHGAARAGSLSAFVEALKFFSHCKAPPPNNRVCIMCCSGGEAALAADSAASRPALALPPFAAPAARRLRAALGARAQIQNPLDYHTFVWGNFAAMQKTFAAALAANCGTNILVLDFPRADKCEIADFALAARAFDAAAAKAGGGKRAFVLASSLTDNMPEEMAESSAAACRLCGLEEALDATAAAVALRQSWARPPPPLPPAPAAGKARPLRMASEATAKRALVAAGVGVARGRVALGAPAAGRAAAALGGAVAVKILGVAHKSDVGGVALNLQTPAAAQAAAAAMQKRGLGRRFLVEKMLPPARAEVLLCAFVDPFAGLCLSMAAGGIHTEAWQDSATIALPASGAEIRRALAGLRLAVLWRGGRGARAQASEAALVAAAQKIAAFACKHSAQLGELEVNPLLVYERGAVAADALLLWRQKAATIKA